MSQAGIPPQRWELPRSIAAMRVLLYLMFGLTLLGAIEVLNSLLDLGSHITPTLTLAALYAVAPGIAAAVLARLLWTGGKAVWIGLMALQLWLLVGAIANLYAGSSQGLSQLLLPGVLLALVGASASRSWFELPAEQRALRPAWTRERLRRAAFPSIPHLITWRRNRGQTSFEYLGLICLVVAIIGALALGGVGGQITGRLQDAVCSLGGGDCSSDNVAGDDGGQGDDTSGGSDSGGNGGSGGSGGSGGDSGGSAGGDSGSDSGGVVTGGNSGGDGDDDSGGASAGGSGNGSGSGSGGSSGGGKSGGDNSGGSDSGGDDSDGGVSAGGVSGGSSGGKSGGDNSGGSDSGGSSSSGGSHSGGSSSGGSDSGGSSSGGSDSGGSDSSSGGSDSGGSNS
ncbi:hypothetical protein ACFVW8_38820, partial [Streptomyces sp. NPDC058221]